LIKFPKIIVVIMRMGLFGFSGVVVYFIVSGVHLASSFSSISTSTRQTNIIQLKLKNNEEDFMIKMKSRREMIFAGIASTLCTSKIANAVDEGERLLYTTKSGLKYLDLKEGSGRQPRYGELVTFSYKAFIKVAGKNTKPELYDEDRAFITKHGNGRLIPGLDEGLHTLKVGGKRRLIIPPKLGYVAGGLGPLPSGFLGREKLNSLIDQMIAKQGGQIIFEIEMLGVVEDEADQGYYNDKSLTPEQFALLRANIQKAGAQARAQNQQSNQI